MHGRDWVALICWAAIMWFLMFNTQLSDYHIGLIAVILPCLYLIFGSGKGARR